MLDLRSLGFDYKSSICKCSLKEAGNYVTIVKAQIQGSITEYKSLTEYSTRSVIVQGLFRER
jgi:hypothetical protein